MTKMQGKVYIFQKHRTPVGVAGDVDVYAGLRRAFH